MALAGVAVVFAVLAGYDLISGGALSGGPASPTTSPKATVSTAGPLRTTAPASTSSAASSSATRPATTLTVAHVTAFGPDGASDGDNPGMASRVIDGGGAWNSSWYATAEFGGMESGTGILLDMGRPVTVNSVQVVLGSSAGANVQVRVGDAADFGSLSTAASMSNVHGTVHLPLDSPASARYVLLWFTKLPRNSQGEYQVSIYRATVNGHA